MSKGDVGNAVESIGEVRVTPAPRFAKLSALLVGAVLGLGSQPATAQVPVCQALTLYGNAVFEGLCKSLSPGTQNLWVCAMTTGSRDVHTTFNAATALHLTVRDNPSPPGCDQNSTFAGNWPGAIVIAAGQPVTICGVSVTNYVARLNAVNQMAGGATTLCRAPFLAASNSGKISPALAQTYLNLCNAQACP
jgi:hypothetical protein